MMFWKKKKQKGAEYPVSLDNSDTTLEDLYKLDSAVTQMRIISSWEAEKDFMPPSSCSSYGNDLYGFASGTSGTSHLYDNGGTRFLYNVYVTCKYCGSKNEDNKFKCESCGAPL